MYTLTFWSGLSARYVPTGHGYGFGVICYIDDILVTGSTDEENLERLEKVLQRLKEYELRVKKTKFNFFANHLLSIWAIKWMPMDCTPYQAK